MDSYSEPFLRLKARRKPDTYLHNSVGGINSGYRVAFCNSRSVLKSSGYLKFFFLVQILLLLQNQCQSLKSYNDTGSSTDVVVVAIVFKHKGTLCVSRKFSMSKPTSNLFMKSVSFIFLLS